jgi:hypothetical protein
MIMCSHKQVEERMETFNQSLTAFKSSLLVLLAWLWIRGMALWAAFSKSLLSHLATFSQ